MPTNQSDNINNNGWSEYSKLVLSKLEELHNDNKDIKKVLDNVNNRLTKLEAGTRDVQELERWQKEVTDTWSTIQMKEAKDEIYKQKEKWTGAWFIFVGAQIIWSAVIAFKDKLFD